MLGITLWIRGGLAGEMQRTNKKAAPKSGFEGAKKLKLFRLAR